jgi:hypothetical protein
MCLSTKRLFSPPKSMLRSHNDIIHRLCILLSLYWTTYNWSEQTGDELDPLRFLSTPSKHWILKSVRSCMCVSALFWPFWNWAKFQESISQVLTLPIILNPLYRVLTLPFQRMME